MKEQIQSAISAFQTIQRAAEACRIRVQISRETDAVHQMLEGVIETCVQQIAALMPLTKPTIADSAALLPAMKAVLSRHPEAIAASVSFFSTATTEEAKAGIPLHQPLQEQCDWVVRKGATQITLCIKLHDDTIIFESFPAHQLVGPNFSL
jgi:hypothetical protein